MKKQIAKNLLIASVFAWGIYCGGQIFNELMVVPRWSASPPETIKAYDAIPKAGGAPFFEIFGPACISLAITAAIAAWKYADKSRKWLALAASVALVVLASLLLYLVPLVRETHAHAMIGDWSNEKIISNVQAWKLGNRIRLFIESFGFLCSIIAFHIWSKETEG